MDYKILTTINKVIKSKNFKKYDEKEKYELIIQNLKLIVMKFLVSLDIEMSEEEKLSNMLIELNYHLDYSTKQKFNLELSHAIINGIMASTGRSIDWVETDNKSIRMNPILTYDMNMTLESIKTYSEMDLSNLSLLLIRTIEANLNDNNIYRLKTTK